MRGAAHCTGQMRPCAPRCSRTCWSRSATLSRSAPSTLPAWTVPPSAASVQRAARGLDEKDGHAVGLTCASLHGIRRRPARVRGQPVPALRPHAEPGPVRVVQLYRLPRCARPLGRGVGPGRAPDEGRAFGNTWAWVSCSAPARLTAHSLQAPAPWSPYFFAARNLHAVPSNAAECADKVGLDKDALKQCVASNTGPGLLRESAELSASRGIRSVCTPIVPARSHASS